MWAVLVACGDAAGDYSNEVVTFCEIGLVRAENFVDSGLGFIGGHPSPKLCV